MSGIHAAFYGPDARNTYVSIRVAIVLLGGAALVIGFLAGFSAVLVLVWWFPLWAALRLAALIFSLTALGSYLAFLKFWWLPKVDTIESDLYHLQSGQFIAAQPVQIENRIDNGRVIQIGRPPASRYQLLTAARIVLDGGTLSHRSLSGIFSPKDIAAFQTWLVSQNYAAWRVPDTPQQGIEVTSRGLAMFRACLGPLAASPTPPMPDSEGWENLPSHTHTREGQP